MWSETFKKKKVGSVTQGCLVLMHLATAGALKREAWINVNWVAFVLQALEVPEVLVSLAERCLHAFGCSLSAWNEEVTEARAVSDGGLSGQPAFAVGTLSWSQRASV